MTPPISRRNFLKATALLPVLPGLDAVAITPRWNGIEAEEIKLGGPSLLYTGAGIWSEDPEEDGAYDQPLQVYEKLTQEERDYPHLNLWDGLVHYDGSWENEGLNELAQRMYELELPWSLSDDWRWMGDWFFS